MIQARHDKVVIEPVKLKDVTDGGIHLPDNSKVQNAEGTVVAKGPDVPADIEVGCVVVHARYGGQEVESDGVNYLIVPESQIFAVKAWKTHTA